MRQDFGHIEFENIPYVELLPPALNYTDRHLSDLDRFPTSLGKVPRVAAWAEMVQQYPEILELEEQFPALGNPELPVFSYRDEITTKVEEHQVVIVVGETGSGKSTQIPQMLIEHGYQVTQSQPRRMAARNVAERMQFELEATLGVEAAAGMVGYQTAETCTLTGNTRISVITDGIQLMKQLGGEPSVDGRHVYMLDEVHEWGENTEVTIGLIKRIVAKSPDAKFILTSATMDAHSLSRFFADVTGEPAPVIEVPGRMYEIDRYEKPESTVADEVIASATENPDKDMLVFVPGKQEINDTIDEIRRRLPEDVAKTAIVLPLHSKMRSQDQDLANQPTDGLKVIVATNVAQTSLTIEGIEVVIDAGLRRGIELDEEGIEGLYLQPVSRADCDQRAGRTGRVGPGKYVLTRYNERTKFVAYADRQEYPPAEIWSSNLDRATLRTAAAGIDISYLGTFHDVEHQAIERAKEALYDLGALDEQGNITEVGRRMDAFPVKVTSARMLMEALPYSEKIRAQLTAIVAAEEVGGLQYFSPEAGRTWQRLTEETTSDLFAQLDIFIAAQGMTDAELISHDLDVRAVRRAQEVYRRLIRRGELGETDLSYPTADERKALEQSICAGLINWVYEHQGGGAYRRVGAPNSALRELSNRSVVERRPRLVAAKPRNVEFMRSGQLIQRQILEQVTAIQNPQVLGEVAAQHLISWQPERHVWRNGVLKSVSKQVLHGALRLGSVMEMEAVDTAETVALVRQSILDRPGSAQRRLRDIKNELQDIQRLTLLPVTQMTQADFLRMLDRAIAEAGVFNQHFIDEKLGEIMEKDGISLDGFIPESERSRIQEGSPAEFVTDSGAHFPLTYAQGNPIVAQYDWMDIGGCPDQLFLPDGREIRFRHGQRLMPPVALRATVEMASV